MDKMLYISMTGASQNTKALQAHANNLANVSTSGFKRDFAQARSMQVFGDGLPARVYAMSERPGTDFTSGTLQETGRDLDVAAVGDAWLAVQAADGSEAYVRTGSLQIDALGMLRTASGLPVMGNAGPIAVPPEQKVEIGQDGTVSIRALGEAPSVMAEVDRLKLVLPDSQQMEKGADGQIVTSNGFALEPAIMLPPEVRTFTVGEDGTATVTTAGNPQPQIVGNIQITDFVNPAGLEAIGNNLFLETASSGAPQDGTPGLNGLGTVLQNTLENSNASVVEELVNMITTQRAYEMNSKVISTADQMLSLVTQQL